MPISVCYQCYGPDNSGSLPVDVSNQHEGLSEAEVALDICLNAGALKIRREDSAGILIIDESPDDRGNWRQWEIMAF